MANVDSWGWYVPSDWPGFNHHDDNNLDHSGNGLSIDPAGYTDVTLVDFNNDGVIHDDDSGDGSSPPAEQYVIGTGPTKTVHEIALYKDSTVVMSGQSYVVDMQVTLFTDGSYTVRIMDYDMPAGHHKNVTDITLGTWDGTEYGGLYTSDVDQAFVCFAAGTKIWTEVGSLDVAQLRPGDRVLTVEGQMATVCWTGRRTVAGRGKSAPICIAAGTLGNTRDVLVSAQHRLLVSGPEVEMLFAQSEVLVAARHLVNGGTIRQAPMDRITYVHFACAQHQIIRADGLWAETLLPGSEATAQMSALEIAGLVSVFPQLEKGWSAYGPAARMCLTAPEARLLQSLLMVPADLAC